MKAMPAPEANAELQFNIDVCSNKLLILLIATILVMLCFIQLLNTCALSLMSLSMLKE